MVHTRPSGTLSDVVDQAIAEFGAAVTPKLRNTGQREEQLRAPLEQLLRTVARGMRLSLVPQGEPRLPNRTSIPDYIIFIEDLPVGYVELKAPGKGVDPDRWTPASHDRKQFGVFKFLPNILYTDGDSWALYQAGKRVGRIAELRGSVDRSGAQLAPADGELLRVLASFLQWVPQTPENIEQLVKNIAGLCSLLRDEVRETLNYERAGESDTHFADLVEDWRRLLFPNLTDEQFADAYAQTVTFGLLLARVNDIHFEGRDVEEIARLLGKSHSLMGKALDVLTQDWVLGQLATTVQTLTRVIAKVHWDLLDDGSRDVYLHLYENFLAVYDSELRKQTGSYYTPSPVVTFMVRFVDEILRDRLGLRNGFAEPGLFTVDPAMGTGTFLVEIIDHVARKAGSNRSLVKARLRELAGRLVGFEKQACPYAVAELRVAEAMRHYQTDPPTNGMRLYVVDTLDADDTEKLLNEFGEPLRRQLGTAYEPIERSRREANKVKGTQRVEVVIGNPPYLEQAKGLGGWIEQGNLGPRKSDPPLAQFRTFGEGRYQYKLSNLYVYFWRWATWKVFDAHPEAPTGIVAFITASSYLDGKGFSGIRRYLRSTADEGWIINVSPEGHRPPVPTRIFPGVSQPLCIGFFVRYGNPKPDTPARLYYRSVDGLQADKFEQLKGIGLGSTEWETCSTAWEASLKPAAGSEWASFPAIADLFPWSTPGITPNRTWVHAPDPATLQERWKRLIRAPIDKKGQLLKQTESRTIDRFVPPIEGFGEPRPALCEETGPCLNPVRLGFRSFDRQWLIPDSRVIDRPRRELWRAHSEKQVYMTEPRSHPVTGGPALTFTAELPDVDHYHGRGGRAIPLYRNSVGTEPNITPRLLEHLSGRLNTMVSAEQLLAYVAAIAAHPGFSDRFANELNGSGVRVPLTAATNLFFEARDIGDRVLWLHTYAQRNISPPEGRPAHLPESHRPQVAGVIPTEPELPPDRIEYDAETETVLIGQGRIYPVPPAVWAYEVSGMRVLRKWFRSRTYKPSGRYPTELDHVRPVHWTIETIDELLDLLQVLGMLVELELPQRQVLERVCSGPLITVDDLLTASVLPVPIGAQRAARDKRQATLF